MKQVKLILGLLVLLAFSCANDARVLSETAPGKKQLAVPGGLEIYNSRLRQEALMPGKGGYSFRIFTNINVSCATCLQKLEAWNQFYDALASCKKVLIVPVCTSRDRFEILKYLVEEGQVKNLKYPLLLDSSGVFGRSNPLLADEMSGVAVLTGGDNTVLLTGHAIEDQSDRKRLLERVCNSGQ